MQYCNLQSVNFGYFDLLHSNIPILFILYIYIYFFSIKRELSTNLSRIVIASVNSDKCILRKMHYREDNCVSRLAQQIRSFKKAPHTHADQESAESSEL